MKRILKISIIFISISVFSQEKFILKSTDPRFETTEKRWSQTIGDVSVCLWNDDKLSAFTVTIDDNNEQDIPYWQELQKKYNIPYTWFVITESENKKDNVKNWNLFKELAKQGNAIQGHDVKNWFEDKEKSIEFLSVNAYNKKLNCTKSTIEKKIKDRCLTYAYPWGKGNENEAEKHFIACRGVVGLLNKANNVNFKNVRSISNPHIYINDSTRNHYILPLITKTKTLEDINYYRGWGSTHFHSVITNKEKIKTNEFLNYLKEKENQLWLGTFPDVAKYAQEYATHSIKITNNTEDKIGFILTDEMQDEIYNFPLTVKVRVPNNWSSIEVLQNDKEIKQSIINYNNNQYVLVYAKPNCGEVILKGVIDGSVSKNNAITRYENTTLRDEFYVPKTISKEAQKMMRAKKRSKRNTAQTPKGDAPHSDWKEFQDNVDKAVLSGLQPIKDKYTPTIDTVFIGGIRAIDIKPNNYEKTNKVVIYIHGGAYVVLHAEATLASMLPLAETSGLRIIAIDYSLAPQSKFDKITNEVIQFYKGLLKDYDAKNIAIYGDSAGGGLAAGSILKMKDLGLVLPSCLVLWSPWSDIDEIGDTYFTLADNDPSLVNTNFLENAALAYAPKSEFKNPYVSPVYGDFSKGFPPTLIQVGSKEIFLSNAIRMYRVLDDANIETKLDVYEGMWHVWQGHYLLPESKKAVENTKKFIFKHLNIN